jgi:hypothetical protein
MNLFMQLGNAVSVSGSQTIFNNRLPVLLSQYAPDVDVNMVLKAGATGIRGLLTPEQLPGFLEAYNRAVTDIFVSIYSSGIIPRFPPLTLLVA